MDEPTAALGPDSRELAPELSNYALLLRKLKRKSEASRVEMRLKAISGK